MRFSVSRFELCGVAATHLFGLGLCVLLGAHGASGAEAAVGAVAQPRALPRYFTVELSGDGALFADGIAVAGSEELEAAARKAVAAGAFAGAALFGEGERAARLTELREVLGRAGFVQVIEAGRSAPRELSVAWRRAHEQQLHEAAQKRLVAAGVLEGEGAASAPHRANPASSHPEPKLSVAREPTAKGSAPKGNPGKSAAPKGAVPKAAKPEPKLELQTVGLHLAAPANQEPTRKRLVRLFETQFDAFRRCHKSAPEHDYNASFGVDLLVPKAGGKAQVREVRTRLVSAPFRSCMEHVFQAIQFEPLPTGREEIVSYSVLFKAPGR